MIKPPATFLQNPNTNAFGRYTESQQRDNSCREAFITVNMKQPNKNTTRKHYEKPTAIKLTREEAKLKLMAPASRGDQGAKDLLEMMFPEDAKKLSKKQSA
jgi:hypothetical protein